GAGRARREPRLRLPGRRRLVRRALLAPGVGMQDRKLHERAWRDRPDQVVHPLVLRGEDRSRLLEQLERTSREREDQTLREDGLWLSLLDDLEPDVAIVRHVEALEPRAQVDLAACLVELLRERQR